MIMGCYVLRDGLYVSSDFLSNQIEASSSLLEAFIIVVLSSAVIYQPDPALTIREGLSLLKKLDLVITLTNSDGKNSNSEGYNPRQDSRFSQSYVG